MILGEKSLSLENALSLAKIGEKKPVLASLPLFAYLCISGKNTHKSCTLRIVMDKPPNENLFKLPGGVENNKTPKKSYLLVPGIRKQLRNVCQLRLSRADQHE